MLLERQTGQGITGRGRVVIGGYSSNPSCDDPTSLTFLQADEITDSI